MPVPTWAPSCRLHPPPPPPPVEPEPSLWRAPPGVGERSRAAIIAPSGAAAMVAATTAAAVATAAITAAMLLLLLVEWRLLSPRGGKAAQSRHDARIAAPHLPQAFCNGPQLLRSLELGLQEMLAVPVRQHPKIDGPEQLLQGCQLEGVEARQHHRRQLVDSHLREVQQGVQFLPLGAAIGGQQALLQCRVGIRICGGVIRDRSQILNNAPYCTCSWASLPWRPPHT
jgi:hypothetical protein